MSIPLSPGPDIADIFLRYNAAHPEQVDQQRNSVGELRDGDGLVGDGDCAGRKKKSTRLEKMPTPIVSQIVASFILMDK